MTRSARRGVLGLAVLVILLAAVAVASTGSVPAGASAARRPSDRAFDVFLSLLLVLMAFGVLLWGYVFLMRGGALARAAASHRRGGRWRSAAGFAICAGILVVLIFWLPIKDDVRRGLEAPGANRIPTAPVGDSGAPAEYEPQFATGPVLVVVVLLVAALVGWYLAIRARRRRLGVADGQLAPLLSDVLEETLHDLRAEPDPRRAVIAAYARMERALAAYGLPRSPSEAPDEYLERVFSDLTVSRMATARLTALFARAKFSTHDVEAEMKRDAIEALIAVREELRSNGILEAARSLSRPPASTEAAR